MTSNSVVTAGTELWLGGRKGKTVEGDPGVHALVPLHISAKPPAPPEPGPMGVTGPVGQGRAPWERQKQRGRGHAVKLTFHRQNGHSFWSNRKDVNQPMYECGNCGMEKEPGTTATTSCEDYQKLLVVREIHGR